MIHVENLTKYYDGLCAVKQINFDVRKGEILGVAGVQGNGQTEFVEALTGLRVPLAGRKRLGQVHVALDKGLEGQGDHLLGLLGCDRLAEPRAKDDRSVRADSQHFFGQFASCHVGHGHIRDDKVKPPGFSLQEF